LPHQLYVANEVGKRSTPRVLLADEVGLGKTIEAGIILHRMVLSGESQRVLIMVPESLQFQWLVEMRRRFNLNFSLFDAERLMLSEDGNPFDDEQLVLCSSDLFLDPQARELALATRWDLAIVDEVHRLAWSPDAIGEEFEFLKQLAAITPGLLLLTATPEQVGQEAHFARLALLDPERFHDYESFRADEARYQHWSDLLDALDRGESPGDLPEDIDRNSSPAQQAAALIDRYGTGRVLFRNSRAAVGGFPARELTRYPLAAPDNPVYRKLYPDLKVGAEDWLKEDPRVPWLVQQLRELRPEKVLVICAHADTALALEHYLQLRAGIRSAAFHEYLSIVERDRAAAYFAEREQGAQVLICSEIGGEGRNFQFAQHLILFDLPPHPDQLEQRIGRLDRIGQREKIFLHVPYINDGAQETLMRWYDEGMDLFHASCSAGDMILQRFATDLHAQLKQRDDSFDTLISDTRAFTDATRAELRDGRDRLLERSSCNKAAGIALAEAIAALEEPSIIAGYLEQLCDVSGVEHEEHGEFSAVLRPGEQELLALFPELPEDGLTVTVSRDQALEREDWVFLGWEHPWLEGAMETLLGSTLGQACVGALSLRGVPPGSRLYELIFTVTVSAPRHLGIQRFLPLTPQRLLLDARGRDLGELLSHARLNERIEKLPRGAASKIVRQLQDEIEARVDDAEKVFAKRLQQLQEEARASIESELNSEIARLEALQLINPAVRPDEITGLQERRDAAVAALVNARATLQGVRLVLTR
jgi:ATP-dependent helicase HepA